MATSSASRRLTTPADAAALFAGLARWPRETVGVGYLDPEWRLLAMRHAAGGRDHASLSIRAVVRDALAWNAARVIVAHNHPSGDAEPSAGDLGWTRQLAQALGPLGVTLVDHLILAGAAATSLRVRGAL